jgi:hypothetical protein
MLMLLQAETAPPLPWWVLYVAILGVAYGTWKLTVLRWWGGCFAAFLGWIVLFFVAAAVLPVEATGLILAISFLPPAAFVLALMPALRGRSPDAGARPRFPGPAFRQLPPGVMEGQPGARAVQRAKVMVSRYEAGMPRNAAWVARLRYVSGVEGLSPRPVDLFVGGGRLWVAPLTAEPPPPFPIPVRDVLRVDVWPEAEGPPTLRVNWSPPAGDGTRDLVLATLPAVPPDVVAPQLEAIAAMLTGLIRAESEAADLAAAGAPQPPAATDAADAMRICPTCGETVPPGASACPRCAKPV